MPHSVAVGRVTSYWSGRSRFIHSALLLRTLATVIAPSRAPLSANLTIRTGAESVSTCDRRSSAKAEIETR
jgi:hypothetical protein